MKILLTGASGFLGAVFYASWSNHHEVIRLGRGSGNDITADLSTDFPPLPDIDLVVHAAGKAHSVPKNHIEAQEFFDVNVTGTAHLLKALTASKVKPKKFIFISSVSVYGIDSGENITEDAELKAKDPYGKSKADAERLIEKWCSHQGIDFYMLRLPLIAGPNPPGNLGAMIRAIQNGIYFSVKGNTAKRSIISAKALASFIPEITGLSGVYNLTGNHHPALTETEKIIGEMLGKKIKTLPRILLKLISLAGDIIPVLPLNSNRLKKLTSTLTFSDEKARKLTGWNPDDLNLLKELS